MLTNQSSLALLIKESRRLKNVSDPFILQADRYVNRELVEKSAKHVNDNTFSIFRTQQVEALMGSNSGAAVSKDEDSTNSPEPSGSKKATGSAGGNPPAQKKKTAGKKKSVTKKKATRKSATGNSSGKKPDSKNATHKKSTGIKKAAIKVAGGRAASEKKIARRSRKRLGPAGAATLPDAVAQTSPAANTDDPRSLAWMATAAVRALNTVRENQAAKDSHLLNAQGTGTSAPAAAAEAAASPAGSGSYAESPAVSLSGEVSAPGEASLSPQEQPEAAVTLIEDTTPSAAVTELAREAGKPEAPAADETAESAVAQAVEQSPPAVAPRRRVQLSLMAGAVALVLAVMIGYGYLADEDEVAVPVTDETPAIMDHSVQATTESATKIAAPGETGVAPHEQPVAATAEGTVAGLPPDESPVPVPQDEGSGTANVPPQADPDTHAADAVPQQAATTATQPVVPEPVSRPEAEPASTTASRTTAPDARQPDYRSPGYGYYPPDWRQPGFRYPAR